MRATKFFNMDQDMTKYKQRTQTTFEQVMKELDRLLEGEELWSTKNKQ